MNTARDGLSWEALWARGIKRGDDFDAWVCHPALLDLLKGGKIVGGTDGPSGFAFNPGCGRGYEVLALAESGLFEGVVGLDLSETGVAAANALRDEIGGTAKGHSTFICGDFFKHEPDAGCRYRVAVDYSFLCALPPELRTAWAQKLADVVEGDGVLVTLMYPLKKPPADGGPPYGVSFALYEELLTKVGFEAVEPPHILPDELCHPSRGDGASGIGRWIRQKRTVPSQ